MKTLHEVPEPTPTFIFDDADDAEGDAPICPFCGDRFFSRRETGSYTESHHADFTQRDDYPDENWDNQDTEMFDSDPWQCARCGENCPDWLSDMIDDRR